VSFNRNCGTPDGQHPLQAMAPAPVGGRHRGQVRTLPVTPSVSGWDPSTDSSRESCSTRLRNSSTGLPAGLAVLRVNALPQGAQFPGLALSPVLHQLGPAVGALAAPGRPLLWIQRVDLGKPANQPQSRTLVDRSRKNRLRCWRDQPSNGWSARASPSPMFPMLDRVGVTPLTHDAMPRRGPREVAVGRFRRRGRG
jgi:hypothetical protein